MYALLIAHSLYRHKVHLYSTKNYNGIILTFLLENRSLKVFYQPAGDEFLVCMCMCIGGSTL
jgi:hypothetical protein